MSPALERRTVVLGVTGSIAAYRAADLAREFMRAGARVHVVMTAAAERFVTPLTFEALTGTPVLCDLFERAVAGRIPHIALAEEAELLVIAPASATTLARLAHGLADDLLACTVLASRAPVLLAPAMNPIMWANAVVQQNVARLATLGRFQLVEPGCGSTACGMEGQGRLAELDVILAHAERALTPALLRGTRIVVTAGPTREPLDPVRYLSNASSGRMGFALARAAWMRGADVTLVHGPTELRPPCGVRTVAIHTVAEMHAAVLAETSVADWLLMAAAPADFRPATVEALKVKKAGRERWPLELLPTEDVLRGVRLAQPGLFIVGFAAETDDVVARARHKLSDKALDAIFANPVGRPDSGFEVDRNEGTLLWADGSTTPFAPSDKATLAAALLEALVARRAPAAGPARHGA